MEASEGSHRTEPRLTRNSVANLAGNVWSALLGIVTLPLLVNGLGATGFGVWALLQTFSATTGWFSLAELGIGTALARETAHRRATHEDDSALAATGLTLLVLLGIVFSAGFAVVALAFFSDIFSVPEHLRSATRVAIVAASVQIIADLTSRGVQAVAEGAGRLDLARGFDVVRRTLEIGAATVVASTVGDIGQVVTASAVASVIALTITWIFLGRRFIESSRPTINEARHLFHVGQSFAFLNGVGVLHRTMDRLIAGIVLGPATAGLIEVAGQVQTGITSVVVATSYPTVSSTPYVVATRGYSGASELTVRATRWCLFLSAPLVGLVAVLATPLVDVWLDVGDPVLPTLVRLAVAYSAVSMLTAVSSYVLQGLGRASALVQPSAVAVGVNLALTVILANLIGAEGVYLATIIAATGLVVAILAASRAAMGLAPATLARDAFLPGLLAGVGAAAGASIGYLFDRPSITLAVGLLCGGVVSLAAAVASAPEDDRSRVTRVVKSVARRSVRNSPP